MRIVSIGGGPALNLPITDGNFTTADGRRISLTVTGVPATTSGTFTAKAGLSTDGGASVTEVAVWNANGSMVRNSYDGTVLNVDVQNLVRTGSEEIKFEGTFDAFTTLITLRDLLHNPANEAGEDIREMVIRGREPIVVDTGVPALRDRYLEDIFSV